MLKQSIFTTATGLLWSHFPYIIKHYKNLGYFMPLYNRMIAQVLYSKPVTWKDSLKQWNRNKTMKFSLCLKSYQGWNKSVHQQSHTLTFDKKDKGQSPEGWQNRIWQKNKKSKSLNAPYSPYLQVFFEVLSITNRPAQTFGTPNTTLQ